MKEIIVFHSRFCGACQEIMPVVRKLAKKCKDCKYKEVEIDNEEGSKLADKYNVEYVPTFFVDGKKVEVKNYEDLKKIFE